MLVVIIGIFGFGFYWVVYVFGFNIIVWVVDLQYVWWMVLVFIGLVGMNVVFEEIVMIGYFFMRWGQIGWLMMMVIVILVIICGIYYFYQGWGDFIGNIVMGLFLGWVFFCCCWFLFFIVVYVFFDIVFFLGYVYLVGCVSWL